MIDYEKMDNFFIGVSMRVIINAGGMPLELGEDIPSLFYKLDEDHYADVNREGVVAQVLKKDAIITSHYVLHENNLHRVNGKLDIILNSGPIKRLKFNPLNYKYNK